MIEPVIVSAIRTPVGKYNKSLKDFTAPQLGAIAIKEALKRLEGKVNYKDVDEVIVGNVLTAGIGQAPARQAALYAGLPYDVAAVTINIVCGSGLKAVMFAAQSIKAGDNEIVVAGGQESMSNVPYYLPHARFGYYYGNDQLIDGLEYDGLRDAYSGILMGMTGEIVAEKYHVTREDCDHFAYRSHRLAIKARENSWTKDEIIPIEATNKKAKTVISEDDGPRKDTNYEILQQLKPAFKESGVVTAGNASMLSDGAAAVIVMSSKKAQ